MSDINQAARKIIYRCTHRGTKELDLILGTFARQYVGGMDSEVLQEFQEFIELPEPILQDMLTDKADFPVTMSSELRSLLANFTYKPGDL